MTENDITDPACDGFLRSGEMFLTSYLFMFPTGIQPSVGFNVELFLKVSKNKTSTFVHSYIDLKNSLNRKQ